MFPFSICEIFSYSLLLKVEMELLKEKLGVKVEVSPTGIVETCATQTADNTTKNIFILKLMFLVVPENKY